MINVYNKARQYFSVLTTEEHINAKAKMNKNGGCSGDNLNEINSDLQIENANKQIGRIQECFQYNMIRKDRRKEEQDRFGSQGRNRDALVWR